MDGNFVSVWVQGLGESFFILGEGVAMFAPKLVIAILIFLVGWIIATVLGRVVEQAIKAVKVDSILQGLGFADVLSRAGFQLNSGCFLGALIRWFVIVVFLVASLDIIGLSQVNEFLRDVVLGYLPNVIAAVIIILVAAVVADVMQKIVVGGAKAAEIKIAQMLGGVTKWAIWVFAIIVALDKLGILSDYGTILFQGFVYMFVIAGGLAFGLGGKEAAARFIEGLRKEISHDDK